MSGGDVNAMLEKCKELDQLRDEQEKVFQEINKIHKKLQTNPEIVEKSGDVILGRLKNLYCHAKDLCESEVSASTTLMNQIDCLIQSGVSAAQRKKIDITKKRMKPDSDNSRFPPAPSMRSQLELAANLKGEQVAARVSDDNAEKDEWFVVKVTNFDKDTKEFEVLDEEPGDDEESTQQRKYKLPASHIIPFPKKNDPSSAPEFQPGRHVLAVYPCTTALYKATVVNSHRKRKTDDYLLEFDDDEEDGSLPQRSVPFYKVVPLPDGHRQ
ncbi:SAGA-associated factor 29 homolog A-like [Zingiber officinale]|uniref:SAGA-associated factor 29 homolog A-like n=1 Tax=Zingiber officinale TaxID=94328 RepID=UPI001C4D2401|nr:SAGA-associated factor 29 homolog A-like [Zingiber officinale]